MKETKSYKKPLFPLVRFQENRSLDEAEKIFLQRIEDAAYIYRKYQKDFIERNCPFCGYWHHEKLERFHGTYEVAKCSVCGSMFVDPVPHEEALRDYYNNCACNKLLDDLFQKRRKKAGNFILDNRIEAVLKHIGSKSAEADLHVLEVGCGSGSFLSKLKEALSTSERFGRTHLTGIDIDENALRKNDDKALNLVCGTVESFSSNTTQRYDVIVHFELIEHLIDPYRFMQHIRELLSEDGVTVFSTQNAEGLEMVASHYNARRLLAHSIFPPMHLNAFSTLNIVHFAIRCGFKVLGLETPGKLDIDMISLTKDEIVDEGFRMLADLDDNAKGIIQYVTARSNMSSHMQCVFGKL